MVGLVVPDLLHPFFADVAHGLSMALREEGYFLIVTSSEEDPELEDREIEQLPARRLDALVIASVRTNAKAYQRITAQGIPYILIDRRFPGDSEYFVGCDAAVTFTTMTLFECLFPVSINKATRLATGLRALHWI